MRPTSAFSSCSVKSFSFSAVSSVPVMKCSARWNPAVPEALRYDPVSNPKGARPTGSIAQDSGGNIYGVTIYGGVSKNSICDKTQGGCGTVFELTSSSGTWDETVLYNFNGYPDGAYPESALALDASGNVYGTSFSGGEGTSTCHDGCGTVFEVKP